MTEEYDTAAREPPCSLDDVKRVVTDEGDKSASYKVAINSPRSVVMCLLTVWGVELFAELNFFFLTYLRAAATLGKATTRVA